MHFPGIESLQIILIIVLVLETKDGDLIEISLYSANLNSLNQEEVYNTIPIELADFISGYTRSGYPMVGFKGFSLVPDYPEPSKKL